MPPAHRYCYPILCGALLFCSGGLLQADQRFELPLDWSDQDGRYAVTTRIDLPGLELESLQQLVAGADGWCRVARLVPDVRGCRSHGDPGTLVLELRSGSGDGSSEVLHQFQSSRTGDALEARLIAPSAPLGITDAGVSLQAVQERDRLRLTLSYGYRSSLRSRVATGAYLRGAAGNRPGISRDPETDALVTGLRGLLERNAMRYFLALVASLEHADAQAAARAWFDADDAFTADLAEQDRETYLRSRIPPEGD